MALLETNTGFRFRLNAADSQCKLELGLRPLPALKG